MSATPGSPPLALAADWELDFYSRPILDPDGKKRWELLICSTPTAASAEGFDSAPPTFRWEKPCPATSVNSLWLRDALAEALDQAARDGWQRPRRLRTWRPSMRAMVQRAADGLGLELVPSRRCYTLIRWLAERQTDVYPLDPGFMAGPLAPPPAPLPPVPVPLPEAARGDSWSWASLPAAALADGPAWECGFAGLLPLPAEADAEAAVPGIRLFSRRRALAIAGWLAGLEPVRLEVVDGALILEAGLEDRWLLASLPADEAAAAAAALEQARQGAAGLQFLAVQESESSERFEGFWMLRDLPDA